MHNTTVLIVDDDPKIRALLRRCFEEEGFDTIEAGDAATAVDIATSSKLDLITLDLHLGVGNGLDVARAVRKISRVPIIMVTGKDDVIDRIVGLEIGADDYITKPFHIREVLARVRSVLRRSQSQTSTPDAPQDAVAEKPVEHESPAIQFDRMTAIPDMYELWDRDGQLCDLTSGDFKLLAVFLGNPKRVLSRERLMDLINGPEWTPLDRTIDNQVARLRKKVERDPSEPRLIKTVRGIGYTFACDTTIVNRHSLAKRA